MTERERLNRATEDMVQNVKDCGQSLIDNAASIVGNFDYQTDLDIYITIPVHKPKDVPEISININYYPEAFFKRPGLISMHGDENDDFGIALGEKTVSGENVQTAAREVLRDTE